MLAILKWSDGTDWSVSPTSRCTCCTAHARYSLNAWRGKVSEDLGPASSNGYSEAIRYDRDVVSIALGTRGHDETSARNVARRIQSCVASDVSYHDFGNLGRMPSSLLVGVPIHGMLATGSG